VATLNSDLLDRIAFGDPALEPDSLSPLFVEGMKCPTTTPAAPTLFVLPSFPVTLNA
jgi:hypothetical protein